MSQSHTRLGRRPRPTLARNVHLRSSCAVEVGLRVRLRQGEPSSVSHAFVAIGSEESAGLWHYRIANKFAPTRTAVGANLFATPKPPPTTHYPLLAPRYPLFALRYPLLSRDWADVAIVPAARPEASPYLGAQRASEVAIALSHDRIEVEPAPVSRGSSPPARRKAPGGGIIGSRINSLLPEPPQERIYSRLRNHHRLPTTHSSLPTPRSALPAPRYPLLATRYSLLATRSSLFATRYFRVIGPMSQSHARLGRRPRPTLRQGCEALSNEKTP